MWSQLRECCGSVFGRFLGAIDVPRGTSAAEIEHKEVEIGGRDSTDAAGIAKRLGTVFFQFLSGLHAEGGESGKFEVFWNSKGAHGFHAVGLLLFFLDVATVLDGGFHVLDPGGWPVAGLNGQLVNVDVWASNQLGPARLLRDWLAASGLELGVDGVGLG